MAKAGNPRSKARANIFPCGYCEKNVSWSKTAIACDVCDVWFHRSCHSLSVSKFENLAENTWRCYRCQTFLNSSFTYHSYELTSSSRSTSDDLSHSTKNPNEDKSKPRSRSNCSNTDCSPRREFCPPSYSTPDSESQNKSFKLGLHNNNNSSPSSSNISANHSIIQTSTNSKDYLSTLSSHSDISSLLKTNDTNNWRNIILNANGLNMTEKRAKL